MTDPAAQTPGDHPHPKAMKRGLRFERRKRMRFALLAVIWLAVLLAFGWILVRNMIRPPRAAWLWEPAPYFSREGFEAYRKTAEKWRIRTVFSQIHLAEDATLSGTAELRRFIENSSRAGIRVFALAGAPDWIAPERLDETTGLITAIDAFNRTAPNAAGRLAGLQLDVEPYLLPQWSVDPDAVRKRWLRYVDTATSHSHRRRLEIGFAIPFWIDRSVEHNGVKAPFYQHIMSVSDHVAVMSYRTRAGGENGILELSRPMRDYARVRPGVARVYVGVEISHLPSTAVRFLTARSPPRQIEKLGLEWGDRRIRLIHAGPVYMLGLTGTRTRP